MVRVGAKYQATAPTLTDGDNAYLLVDSAGRPIITGPVASDAVAAGNPIPVGGDVDDTSPAAAAEGDRRVFRATPEGNQIVELYKDNNALSPIGAMPGASEVKATVVAIGTTSVDRATVITPTSGKKIRVLSVVAVTYGLTTDPQNVYVYFGTGASIATNPASVITSLAPGTTGSPYQSWPDGAGPVGAVDEVLSWRTQIETKNTARIIVVYREE